MICCLWHPRMNRSRKHSRHRRTTSKVTAVHVTKLRTDGSDTRPAPRGRQDHDRIARRHADRIGVDDRSDGPRRRRKGSRTQLSVHQATGLGAWGGWERAVPAQACHCRQRFGDGARIRRITRIAWPFSWTMTTQAAPTRNTLAAGLIKLSAELSRGGTSSLRCPDPGGGVKAPDPNDTLRGRGP